MRIIPKKTQWKDWTLPSKYSYIGVPLAIFFFFAGLIYYEFIKPNYSKKSYELSQEMVKEMTALKERLGNKLDPKVLLSKYPLGYIIFELGYSNSVLPYDNSLLSEFHIDWNEAHITKNTESQIELRLPDIKGKDGKVWMTDVTTGGAKRVGNLGGVIAGDLSIWGEILEIKNSGIVFLVGFQNNRLSESKKVKEIAIKAVNEFHILYNQGKIENIWNNSDSKFKAAVEKEEYEKIIIDNMTKLGKFKSSSNTRVSTDLSSIPNIVTINQTAKFQNEEIFEVFIINVYKGKSSLVGWNPQNFKNDTIVKANNNN